MTKKDKVEKVMREWKAGTLTSHGRKVTDYDQAVAIALSEAGLSKKYAEGGGIGFIPMDLQDELHSISKRGGVKSEKDVIGILNAIIDSGLTDKDLETKPTRTGTQYELVLDKKTSEVWAKVKANYEGDLKGNQYFSTLYEIIKRNNSNDNKIIERYKPFKKFSKEQNIMKEGGNMNKYAKGGSIDTPKIYVADLEAYNNGKLVGEWLDLSDFEDGEEVSKEISKLLKKWGAEEYAIHDVENVPSSIYSEYMGEEDFDKIIKIYKASEENDLPYEVISEIMLQYEPEDLEEWISDHYEGHFDNDTDLAYNVVESIGSVSDLGEKTTEMYFDYDKFGRDLAINDEWEGDFDSDEDRGYDYVENMGGVSELGERTIDMYFDYEKFGRDLAINDYTEIEDGYYFRTPRYAKGGLTNERRYVNKSQDYEVRYAKSRLKRTGYKNERKFAGGGELRSFNDRIFGKIIIFKEEQIGKFTIGIKSGFNNNRHVFIYEGKKGSYGSEGLPKNFKMTPQISIADANRVYSELKIKAKNNQDLEPFEIIKEKFAVGGEIGNTVTFSRYGERTTGRVTDKLRNGYEVATDDGVILVEPQEVISFSDEPIAKKKRFGFFEGGGSLEEYKQAERDYDKYGEYLEDAIEDENEADIKKYKKLMDEAETKMHRYERKYAGGGEIETVSFNRVKSNFKNNLEIFNGKVVTVGDDKFKIEGNKFYIKKPNEDWVIFRIIKGEMFAGGGEIENKIEKLKKVVSSKMLPESVKAKAQAEIDKLEKELHESKETKAEEKEERKFKIGDSVIDKDGDKFTVDRLLPFSKRFDSFEVVIKKPNLNTEFIELEKNLDFYKAEEKEEHKAGLWKDKKDKIKVGDFVSFDGGYEGIVVAIRNNIHDLKFRLASGEYVDKRRTKSQLSPSKLSVITNDMKEAVEHLLHESKETKAEEKAEHEAKLDEKEELNATIQKLYDIEAKAEDLINYQDGGIQSQSIDKIKKYVEYINKEVSKLDVPFGSEIYDTLQDENAHSLNLTLGLLGFYKNEKDSGEWARTRTSYKDLVNAVNEVKGIKTEYKVGDPIKKPTTRKAPVKKAVAKKTVAKKAEVKAKFKVDDIVGTDKDDTLAKKITSFKTNRKGEVIYSGYYISKPSEKFSFEESELVSIKAPAKPKADHKKLVAKLKAKKGDKEYDNRASINVKTGERYKRSESSDKKREALPLGKRISADGSVYYENRLNRGDLSKKDKFEKGGEVKGSDWSLNLNW